MFPASVQVTLGQLAKEVKEEEDLRSQQGVGAIDSTGRSGRKLDKVPGWELRPGAPKMQLRPEEEARLGLVRQAVQDCTISCPLTKLLF